MKFNKRVTIEELLKLLDDYKYKRFDIHHTWKPDYSNLKNNTPEQLNANMKAYHMRQGTFNPRATDIAQHITTFPDGTILLGRDFGKSPISIAGRNSGAFAMEMVGNFDYFHDIITVEQRNVTLRLIRYFMSKGAEIAFHRDYAGKTCPGTSLNKQGLIDASKYYLDWGVMRMGLTGTDVLELQKLLSKNGYPIKWQDGNFGTDTYNVVREFQRVNGITIDGSVGENTMKLLRGENVTKPIVPSGSQFIKKNGLFIIENDISKVRNKVLLGTLNSTEYDSINGGVFGSNTVGGIWHIAVQDGKLLGGNSYTNDAKKRYKRPTILIGYDGRVTIEYLYDVLDTKRFNSISEIKFALGGFVNYSFPYLDLGYEKIPVGDRRPTNRTAIGYDIKTGKMYFIAAQNKTFQEMHKLIRSNLPTLTGAMGLDGGGSTQMKFGGKNIISSGRPVPSIVIFEK